VDEFEYAIRSSDGTTYLVFATLEAVRAALEAMPAPVANNPRMLKRSAGDSKAFWRPVEVDEPR
jgi:hypothetical protein